MRGAARCHIAHMNGTGNKISEDGIAHIGLALEKNTTIQAILLGGAELREREGKEENA